MCYELLCMMERNGFWISFFLSFSHSLFKGGGSFCFLVYFISKKIRGKIKRKFTLLRIIMYDGKKWILDLVLSLSLRMVVLSVFWFILCRERFEGGLEENLMYLCNYVCM